MLVLVLSEVEKPAQMGGSAPLLKKISSLNGRFYGVNYSTKTGGWGLSRTTSTYFMSHHTEESLITAKACSFLRFLVTKISASLLGIFLSFIPASFYLQFGLILYNDSIYLVIAGISFPSF
jgi:hypothetical protein